QSYSTAKLDSAQIALADFGVLGSIDVISETTPAGSEPNPVVPIRFKAPKTKLRVLRAGVGGEVGDHVELHGLIGWEDRNFLGGPRRSSVEARPGFIFYPVTLSTLFSELPTRILPQLLVRTELRQPVWFDPRTWAIIGGSFNFYRLQTAEALN